MYMACAYTADKFDMRFYLILPTAVVTCIGYAILIAVQDNTGVQLFACFLCASPLPTAFSAPQQRFLTTVLLCSGRLHSRRSQRELVHRQHGRRSQALDWYRHSAACRKLWRYHCRTDCTCSNTLRSAAAQYCDGPS